MSGLEVVGAIASVVQLAEVVISISKQLYEVANALSNAPSDIKDLAHDLEMFHDDLILYADLVNARNTSYSKHFSRFTAKIIGRCAEICVKIDKILKKLRSGSFWAKVKWIYKEKEIVKLLAKLRDLKLSLMGVLSILISVKTDLVLDALGVTTPSVFESPGNEGLSPEIIGDIEETRRKLAGITVSGDLSKRVQDTSEQTNASKSSSSLGTAKTKRLSMRSTPSTLGWTSVENRLEQYKFVVTGAEEPYFELLPKAAITANTPTRIYLDKHQDAAEGVYPCMYPGSCQGKHSFFVSDGLERHYRVAHGGVDWSRETVSQASAQPVAPDKVVDGGISAFRISNQAASPETALNQVVNPQLNVDSIQESASTPVNQANATASVIISPTPNRIMRHQLESMSSFHSAVTHQASNGSLREETSDQRALQMAEMETGGPRLKNPVPTNAQGPAYETWSHDMIESAVKHFGMTREYAESWVRTLPIPIGGMMSDRVGIVSGFPAKDTQPISGEHANNLLQNSRTSKTYSKQPTGPNYAPTAGSQYDQSLGYAQPSLISVVGSQQYTPQHATGTASTSRKYQNLEKDRNKQHLECLTRTNEYFIPGDGIDRLVITADICRYLGNNALVRPGTYENPQTRQEIKGYFISAYRNLTSAMIEDLKADTVRWRSELSAIGSKGQPSSAGSSGLPLSTRQYYGPAPGGVTSAGVEGSSYPSKDSAGYPMGAASVAPIQQSIEPGGVQSNIDSADYYVAGANMLGPPDAPPISVTHPNHTPLSSRSSQLWWHAFHRLEHMDRRISEILLLRWHDAGASIPLNDDPIGQAIAISRADRLLIVLALSDDLPSEDFANQAELSSKTLDSVMAISNIVKVMKSTLNFKVGAFVWALFCQALEAMVRQDQRHSKTRSDHILPHMAEIATLLARYNVMENIYNEWPGLGVDQGLTDSLTRMCALVLLYIGQLKRYRYSHESSFEEVEALRNLDEHIAEIRSADNECRGFTIRTFDEAFSDMVELIENDSNGEEEEPGALILDSNTKRGRDLAGDDDMEGSGWYDYGGMTEADYGEAQTTKRVRFYS